MAIRLVIKMGHPVLQQQAATVPDWQDPSISALIEDLWDTMAAEGGVGIAAPQIGISQQVVVFGFEQSERYPDAPPVPKTVLINPVITPLDEEKVAGWEGCLSVPGLRGVVPRWQRIRYQGIDENGQTIDREAEGFHARVVQHECDHLWGKLYPSRIEDMNLFGFTDVLFPELAK